MNHLLFHTPNDRHVLDLYAKESNDLAVSFYQ